MKSMDKVQNEAEILCDLTMADLRTPVQSSVEISSPAATGLNIALSIVLTRPRSG